MKNIILLAGAMLAAAAVADNEPVRNMRQRRPMGEGPSVAPVVRMASNPKMAEKLGLTDDQKAKLAEINAAQRESMKASRSELRVAMERQMKLMESEKVDESAVMASIDEVFKIRCAMAKEQTRFLIKVKSILTPEQIKQAYDAMPSFRDRGDRRPEGERGPMMRKGARDKGMRGPGKEGARKAPESRKPF